jgi:sugar lactone lactonase YvrE
MSTSTQTNRYAAAQSQRVADGWSLQRLTPPSRLFGANGLRTGPDGRIYVAQVTGSQISAIDVDTGSIETISPMGGDIVAPDDLVFDDAGNLYVTEITEGRVSVRERNGNVRVLYGDLPCANPITFHQGRLFAGECRPDGRILEIDRNGGAPRILVEHVPLPNACAVGPDGKLYYPVMGLNEIWRVGLESGAKPEKVAGDLGVPDSVKFDSKGFIVSTQVASGQLLRIDPRSGERTVLANLTPGLDNLTFVGERMFVSNISGYVVEVLAEGKTRDVVPNGFCWPLGLAVDPTGLLFIADGPFSYTLRAGERPQVAGLLFTPGCPGHNRGAAASGPGEFIVTTANGDVARWRPSKGESQVLASGFDQLQGVALAPNGGVYFVELGKSRVLSCTAGGQVEEQASGLSQPSGVAVATDGTCYVSEAGAGKVVTLSGGQARTVVDGLRKPQGILVRGESLYIVDVGAKEVIEYDLKAGKRSTVASNLPIGAPQGVVPKPLKAIGVLSGPMGPFAGIASGADGTLYVSGDAEGSILAIRRG